MQSSRTIIQRLRTRSTAWEGFRHPRGPRMWCSKIATSSHFPNLKPHPRCHRGRNHELAMSWAMWLKPRFQGHSSGVHAIHAEPRVRGCVDTGSRDTGHGSRVTGHGSLKQSNSGSPVLIQENLIEAGSSACPLPPAAGSSAQAWRGWAPRCVQSPHGTGRARRPRLPPGHSKEASAGGAHPRRWSGRPTGGGQGRSRPAVQGVAGARMYPAGRV